MLNVITSDDTKKWNETVRSMDDFDFYHLAEYHRMDESGAPLLLHYSSETADFALPVILRRIEGTEYNDITSVYGYSGPLWQSTVIPRLTRDSLKNHIGYQEIAGQARNDKTIEAIERFHQDLLQFFDEHSVVSVFSRLHPLFPFQEKILEGLGSVPDTGATVAVDLNLPESEQRRQYSHSLKNDINRLKRKNLIVKKAGTQAEIEAFVDIYTETMNRVHASKIYFFDVDYFCRFLETLPAVLYLAYYEEKIISGSLFTDCNGIIQPHLSATLNDYLHLSPLKYVWDQIRLYGMVEKRNYMHLGGGFGGSRDTLFEFKAQFSRQHFVFKTWRYVHNREIYDQLVYEKFGNGWPESSFFPVYRL